ARNRSSESRNTLTSPQFIPRLLIEARQGALLAPSVLRPPTTRTRYACRTLLGRLRHRLLRPASAMDAPRPRPLVRKRPRDHSAGPGRTAATVSRALRPDPGRAG